MVCTVKTPKAPPPPKQTAPEYLRNPFLDDARNAGNSAMALRAGRNSLRIPLSDQAPGVGFGGRSTGGGGGSQSGTNGRTGQLPPIRIRNSGDGTGTGSRRGGGGRPRDNTGKTYMK